jgi:hypothetical protein
MAQPGQVYEAGRQAENNAWLPTASQIPAFLAVKRKNNLNVWHRARLLLTSSTPLFTPQPNARLTMRESR